jgi:hypothetical protein
MFDLYALYYFTQESWQGTKSPHTFPVGYCVDKQFPRRSRQGPET